MISWSLYFCEEMFWFHQCKRLIFYSFPFFFFLGIPLVFLLLGVLILWISFKQALWLHRRFLSLCWMKQFATDLCNVSSHSEQKISISNGFGSFVDNELRLLDSCSTVLNNDFDDFQAQARLSATYILWLTKVIAFFVLFNIPFCNVGGVLRFPLCASASP
jgi:hypothetical protein